MRQLIIAAALAAMTTAAHAGPWTYERFETGDGGATYNAWQWVESIEEYLIGYECEDTMGLDAFYIQTPEEYDNAASHAPDVPTSFIVDGVPIEVAGTFQTRAGYLSVYYDSFSMDKFGTLFDAIAAAKSTIRVTFFDRDLSFSTEGVGDALMTAYRNCTGN